MIRPKISAVLAILSLVLPAGTPHQLEAQKATDRPSEETSLPLSDYIRTVRRVSYKSTANEDRPAEVAALEQLRRERADVREMAEQVEAGTADTEMQLRLASTYLDAGVYSAALSIYQELEGDPTSVGTAQLGMARIWMDWGQLTIALGHAEAAIEDMPRSQLAWDVAGRIYLRLGRPADAISAWMQADAVRVPNQTLEANIGYAYLIQKEWGRAKIHLENALALGSGSEQVHNNMGIVLAELGDPEGAMEHFTAVNEPASAYNNLGAVYLSQRNWTRAAAAFRTALALDPEHAIAQMNLARADSYVDPPTFVHLGSEGISPVEFVDIPTRRAATDDPRPLKNAGVGAEVFAADSADARPIEQLSAVLPNKPLWYLRTPSTDFAPTSTQRVSRAVDPDPVAERLPLSAQNGSIPRSSERFPVDDTVPAGAGSIGKISSALPEKPLWYLRDGPTAIQTPAPRSRAVAVLDAQTPEAGFERAPATTAAQENLQSDPILEPRVDPFNVTRAPSQRSQVLNWRPVNGRLDTARFRMPSRSATAMDRTFLDHLRRILGGDQSGSNGTLGGPTTLMAENSDHQAGRARSYRNPPVGLIQEAFADVLSWETVPASVSAEPKPERSTALPALCIPKKTLTPQAGAAFESIGATPETRLNSRSEAASADTSPLGSDDPFRPDQSGSTGDPSPHDRLVQTPADASAEAGSTTFVAGWEFGYVLYWLTAVLFVALGFRMAGIGGLIVGLAVGSFLGSTVFKLIA